MEAQIRIASRKEMPGFARPHVCAINGSIHYTFKSWNHEVGIPSLNLTFRAMRRGNDLVYDLPDGRELAITGRGGWLFDGAKVEERWPTTQRRELVCGARTFRVTSEDDTILIDFTGEVLDLRTTIIGFHLYLGNPDP